MDVSYEKPLNKYEAVIILHPDVNEGEQKNFFKRNQETIQSFAGKVNHIDTWGKRRLANPIHKSRIGTYFHTTFEAKPGCVAELERVMRIDDRVLRYLHVRLDDRANLKEHVDAFHKALAETLRREQEKEAKHQARRMAAAGGGPGARGPREVTYGGKRFSGGADDEGGPSDEET